MIVILLICSKLDYTTSLPDIIRIGEEFFSLWGEATTKCIFFRREENPFSCSTGCHRISFSLSWQMNKKKQNINIKYRLEKCANWNFSVTRTWLLIQFLKQTTSLELISACFSAKTGKFMSAPGQFFITKSSFA